MLLHTEFFGAVVEQGRHTGLFHVGAVPLRQPDRLLLCSQHMGDALVLQVAEGHRPQLLQRQVLQVRAGVVQALPQNVPVDRRGQKLAPLPRFQLLPQLRGGHLHHAGDAQSPDVGLGPGPAKVLPLDREG